MLDEAKSLSESIEALIRVDITSYEHAVAHDIEQMLKIYIFPSKQLIVPYSFFFFFFFFFFFLCILLATVPPIYIILTRQTFL